MANNSEIVRHQQQLQTIKDLFKNEALGIRLQQLAPKTLSPDRMFQIMLHQFTKTPKLLDCSVQSLMSAMLTATEMGLEPNGRHAHLVPYKATCQLIPDYKGLIKLAIDSGTVSHVVAELVYENEEFIIQREFGSKTAELLRHTIGTHAKDRGEMIGGYAACIFSRGTSTFAYMTAEEIALVESCSAASGPGTPWKKHRKEMQKKTLLKRLFKTLQINPTLDRALVLDDAAEIGDNQDLIDLDIAEPTEAELQKQYRKEPDPPAGGASRAAESLGQRLTEEPSDRVKREAPSAGGQTSGPSGGDAERQAVVAETTAAPSGGAAAITCWPLQTKVLQLHESIADQASADNALGMCGLVDTAEVRGCNSEATLKEAIDALRALQALQLAEVAAKGGGAAGKQGKLV